MDTMLIRDAIALLLCVTAVRAAEIHSAALDEIIETTRKAWDVPGVAVAIVHGDQTVYIKGFGVRLVGSNDPITPETRFPIGSATKSFTAAAIGILVDEGKMSWDDPVRKHLPYFKLSDPLADASVTIRDLLCHRTGVPNRYSTNPAQSREELIRQIALQPLTHPFRSHYEYQNVMFVAAGEAVGHLAGTTWEDFITRRLLQPLGMINSDTGVKDWTKSSEYVALHQHASDGLRPIPWSTLEKMAPAGGINCSVRDLTRWMRLHLNEGQLDGKVILKRATIKETHTPQMLTRFNRTEGVNIQAYGLGWFVRDYRGHLIVEHPGANTGFASLVTLIPDQRYGIAVLANLFDFPIPAMAGVLGGDLVDELLGLPKRDLSAAALAYRRKAQEQAQKKK